MKKTVSLLLALMMSLSLIACGESAEDDLAVSEEESSAQMQEDAGDSQAQEDVSDVQTQDGPTDEQLQALTDAYNQAAVLYNDVAIAANDNGWMNDEETAAEVQSIGDTLEPIGVALTEDLSALAGADFDELTAAMQEFVPVLEAMAEKVAEPFGGEDMTVVTDEALIPVANALNEVVPIFNEVYATAETNGWLEDEQTATELQTVMGTLTYTQSGLTDDPSKLENVTDFGELADSILQLGDALSEIADRVSVPYGGEG